MKKLFTLLFIVTMFVACSSQPAATEISATDSSTMVVATPIMGMDSAITADSTAAENIETVK